MLLHISESQGIQFLDTLNQRETKEAALAKLERRQHHHNPVLNFWGLNNASSKVSIARR
jgi:hypothetical protein